MKKTATVLVVEDDPDDLALTLEAFKRSGHIVQIHHACDGVQCMDYLRKQGSFKGVPTPDLVLLDLNMPVMDGRDVLTAIGKDDSLRHVPVVVLTTSFSNVDLFMTYRLGCNTFVVKPVDLHDFQKKIDSICEYWFATAILPPSRDKKST